MNRNYISAIALAVAALSAGQAMAADSSVSREQVKAELAAAVRTGNIVSTIDGLQGRKLNEINPGLYSQQVGAQGKTREQVKAELAEAVRTGDIVSTAVGQQGKKLNEINPGKYDHQVSVQGKTREQVKAELVEAIRNGTMPVLSIS